MLEGLAKEPYKPKQSSSPHSFPEGVSELFALSFHPSCMLLHGEQSGATLSLNPSFAPKNIESSFLSNNTPECILSSTPHRRQGGKIASAMPNMHFGMLCRMQGPHPVH